MTKFPITGVTLEKTNQQSHVKILALCFLCTLVYIILYANLTYKTHTVSNMMNEALDDLQKWKDRLELLFHKPNSTFQYNGENDGNQSTVSSVNNSNPLLVLFTTFSASAEKYVCRNNTIKNWISFAPEVKPVFFSDDPDLVKRVKNEGWEVLPPTKSSIGIPILKYMFLDVMKKYPAKFYGFSNGDILFTQNMIETLRFISSSKLNQNYPMLIVGQRTNVRDVTAENAATYESITKIAKTGQLFTPWGEDYFITNSIYPWKDCPEVVIGRVAYDNWLVLNARKRKHTTIDATKTLLALHQTTKAGDKEGHKHANSNYNNRLLGKLYKSLHYGAGLTSCTTYFTTYVAPNGQIQLKERKIHKSCFPL